MQGRMLLLGRDPLHSPSTGPADDRSQQRMSLERPPNRLLEGGLLESAVESQPDEKRHRMRSAIVRQHVILKRHQGKRKDHRHRPIRLRRPARVNSARPAPQQLLTSHSAVQVSSTELHAKSQHLGVLERMVCGASKRTSPLVGLQDAGAASWRIFECWTYQPRRASVRFSLGEPWASAQRLIPRFRFDKAVDRFSCEGTP